MKKPALKSKTPLPLSIIFPPKSFFPPKTSLSPSLYLCISSLNATVNHLQSRHQYVQLHLRPKVTGSPSILHLRFDSDGSPSPERLSSKLHLRPKVTGSPAVLRTLSQGASTLYWINMLYRPIHF
jgi:hypothetical protein